MLCAISGEAPEEPVVSKLSGNVFEKRLIEKYITENGKDPISGEELAPDDLLPLRTARIVRPRPPALTSIPALLSTFQNEWDALALETFNLRDQLLRTREELSTALYQHDAAVRVITRLTKERDEARQALSSLSVSGIAGDSNSSRANNNGGSEMMALDPRPLPESLAQKVQETQAVLSKTRKKRAIPENWAKPDHISTFALAKETDLDIAETKALAYHDNFAAVGGSKGDVAVYSLAANVKERSITVSEPITSALWTDSRIILSTTKGSVKVLENGHETASLTHHAGPATALSLHPSGAILASVGTDKSFIFYDLDKLELAARVFTDANLTAAAFHPDGHLFAVGTATGDVHIYQTVAQDRVWSISLPDGGAITDIAFSENGYHFAVSQAEHGTVQILDVRKADAGAKVKALEVGAATGGIRALAWDWSAQFLAGVGMEGVNVWGYSKAGKNWSELVRREFRGAVGCAWVEEAGRLVLVGEDGRVGVLEGVGQGEE